MPRWLRRVLTRIQELATARRIRFTLKARREIAELDVDLDDEDAATVLERLTASDWARRIPSDTTGECMYVFRPLVGQAVLYVKIIVREDCIVVSFHENDGDGDEDKGL